MPRIRKRTTGGNARLVLVTAPSLLPLPEEKSRRDGGSAISGGIYALSSIGFWPRNRSILTGYQQNRTSCLVNDL
jgi:hypothetical protein